MDYNRQGPLGTPSIGAVHTGDQVRRGIITLLEGQTDRQGWVETASHRIDQYPAYPRPALLHNVGSDPRNPDVKILATITYLES